MEFLIKQSFLISLISVLLSMSCHAALFARDLDGDFSNGHEAVYDDVLNITWQASMSLSRTEKFGLDINGGDGQMTWAVADEWIARMNASNYLGYSSWRLPKVTPLNGVSFNREFAYDGSTDVGFQITAPVGEFNPNGQSAGSTASELSHLYYNSLSAIGPYSSSPFPSDERRTGLDDAISPDLNLFTDIYPAHQAHYPNYWLSGASQPDFAWVFGVASGFQGEAFTTFFNTNQAWAVHDGDIGTAVVPLPASAWLFLSALSGLIGVRARSR